MSIATEPIGSIPRPSELLAAAQDAAVRDTIARPEAIGSPVVTDGEQAKPSFATYPIAGLVGTDCGFSPLADDTSTSRETAFAKIAARVEGPALGVSS